jgi:histidinol-phosphatase
MSRPETPSPLDAEQALQVALAASAAAEVAIAPFAPGRTPVEHKQDASPVTAADRAAERAIRAVLAEACPGHAVYGEEYGGERDGSRPLWLIDPIDGTKSWIAGLPFWSIQIALWQDGEARLGVSRAPALDETASAVRGEPARLDGTTLRCSAVTALQDCRLSLGNLGTLADDAQRWSGLARIVRACNRVRGYGDYYPYHRLAAGQLDAVLESDVNILDVAALSVIVAAAGGVVTDLDGAPLTLNSTTVLAAATPALHAILLETLNDHA